MGALYAHAMGAQYTDHVRACHGCKDYGISAAYESDVDRTESYSRFSSLKNGSFGFRLLRYRTQTNSNKKGLTHPCALLKGGVGMR